MLPMKNPSDSQIATILKSSKVIAMIGASPNSDKPSHGIMRQLLAKGYNVIPVNPNETTILGRPAVASLHDIKEPVDIVNVFRRPEHTPEIAKEAVAIGAKVLWLQSGIINEEAAAIAKAGGLTVIMDACIGVLVARYASF